MTATDNQKRALGVQVSGLGHRYGPREALRGIDLDIAAGERVAISGPSGSGKSTLLHAIAGVLQPDEGRVLLGDIEVTSLNADARSRLRRTQVGVLFQFGQLVEELTLEENVALPLMLEGRGRGDALATARAWLAQVGAQDVATQIAAEVSGGQSQRAALARALVTGPGLLVADEPTGALDSRAGAQVLDLITEISERRGMTCLIVTHDAKVAAYADREIVVRDGQIDGVDDAAPSPPVEVLR